MKTAMQDSDRDYNLFSKNFNGGSSINHALQDYQMQRMLLDQQEKKRLLMARQE